MKVLKECTRFLRSAQDCLQDQPQNELVIRIQPDEAIYYRSIVLGQGRLLDKDGLACQSKRDVCVFVTDRQCKVFDARPCMLGLLVCNCVAVRILAKTPGLSARAHEVQRWDSQVQSLFICCEVHLWTGRKSSCPVPCNYHSFWKFQQAVQRCTQDSHSIKVGRCFQILGILQAA